MASQRRNLRSAQFTKQQQLAPFGNLKPSAENPGTTNKPLPFSLRSLLGHGQALQERGHSQVPMLKNLSLLIQAAAGPGRTLVSFATWTWLRGTASWQLEKDGFLKHLWRRMAHQRLTSANVRLRAIHSVYDFIYLFREGKKRKSTLVC